MQATFRSDFPIVIASAPRGGAGSTRAQNSHRQENIRFCDHLQKLKIRTLIGPVGSASFSELHVSRVVSFMFGRSISAASPTRDAKNAAYPHSLTLVTLLTPPSPPQSTPVGGISIDVFFNGLHRGASGHLAQKGEQIHIRNKCEFPAFAPVLCATLSHHPPLSPLWIFTDSFLLVSTCCRVCPSGSCCRQTAN